MSHPAYHLRPNKAVDRLILLDCLRIVDRFSPLSEYTYHGFGGPHLEDFRLLYESFPDIGMKSLEHLPHTYSRQLFHKPCRTMDVVPLHSSSFLAQYDARDKKSVFWLDNVGMSAADIGDFQLALGKVAANSVVKVTFRCHHKDYTKDPGLFRTRFEEFMPDPYTEIPRTLEGFATMVQVVARVAAEKALPPAIEMAFQPVSSFCYDDGTGMFTLTGIVCLREELAGIRAHFETWPFANLDWRTPKLIDVPTLSTKERLHLQDHLPCKESDGGPVLAARLGYQLDEDADRSTAQLRQYAEFHRYLPNFIRAFV